ncbi:Hvo_1808 family surface protein [Halorientalis brevis]|uniref:Hvo_1808 family surface protein n=1 Tax=Halorientalis brevis TaxID=1126241 RepID=A0ABD6CC92_9EURY
MKPNRSERSGKQAGTPSPREVGRAVAVVFLCLLGITASVVPAAAGTVSNQSAVETGRHDVTATVPPDPPSDRLGWENGVWYNESLDITRSDGYNDSELDAVVARTMARIEQVRGLEFERTPPVRLISQGQQRTETQEQFTDVNRTSRIALNTQYEALLLINESTNAVESQQALFGGGVSGYYNTSGRNITLVSPANGTLQLQEPVLAQELFHAQQDQYFNLSTNISTIEERNARNGIVEGDANYVQYLYEQRCQNEWNGTCLGYNGSDQQQAQEPPANLSIGMVQLYLQPYHSGVAFVRERQQTGGWESVTDVYDQPPNSTEQTIHPDKYPTDEPTNLTVPDRSSDSWEPLRENGERITGSVGEAGLFVSLWLPSFESRMQARTDQETIIPFRTHLRVNPVTGEPKRPVTYNYDHPVTAGWDDDKLVPYVSPGSNETGYVYETAWDSAADAREFRDGYVQLLEYHDANAVEGRANTYRIPEGSEFADAFRVVQHGTEVTIVNAPTVDALSDVRKPSDDATTGSSVDSSRPTATENESNATANGTEDPDTTTSESGPGFGLGSALVALAVLIGGRFGRSRR